MLVHPATPVAAVVLLGIADSFLSRTEANTLHFLVYLILTAVVVISTLNNLVHYGKATKVISLVLCMVCLACLYTNFIRDNQQPVSGGSSSGSGIYQYSDPISFGGNNNSNRSNSGKTCYSCNGTGLYDHGSYVSRCLTCSGDGICNICNGTGRYDCSICHGSGKCTNCR